MSPDLAKPRPAPAEPPPPLPERRNAVLDSLRFVAVTLVLLRHAPPAPASLTPLIRRPFEILARGGWTGVDLFFVLSGFLISGLLFQEQKQTGRLDLKRFWIRRAFKIYPAFWAMIAVACARDAHGRPLFHWDWLVNDLLFLQNYRYSIRPHGWSLAVEEHFYILLPIYLVWKLHRSKTSANPFAGLPRDVLILACVCLALRWLTMEFYPVADNYTHQFPTHLRLDALAFGVLLGYGRASRPEWFAAAVHRWRRWLWALAALLLWPPFVWDLSSSRSLQVLGLTTNYLGFGALLLASLDAGDPSAGWAAVCVRACGAIGAFSYSIYLWHADVFFLLEQIIPPTWPFMVRLGLWLAAGLSVGTIMSLLVERQSLRLRNRFFPSRSRGIGLGPNTRA